MPVRVVAYVTGWCPDCVRSRRILQRSGLQFEEIDIERVAGAEEDMRALNGGSGKVPTIVIEGADEREVLVEPEDRPLQDALSRASRAAAATS